ncbi:MAG: tetratricopeptide repeat protein [Lachnospiraceae bacterium]|nr:tetratricopeptide repeat protein [Lachnospiraceae bacterium]
MEHNNSNLAERQAQSGISVMEKKKAKPAAVEKKTGQAEKNAKPTTGEKKTGQAEKKKAKPITVDKNPEPTEKKKAKPATVDENPEPTEKKKVKPAAVEKKTGQANKKNVKPVTVEKKNGQAVKKKVKPATEVKKPQTAVKKKVKPISEEKKTGLTEDKKGNTESREDFEIRMQRRDELRARRREERRRKVRRQKIAMAVCAGVIVVGAIAIPMFLSLPSMKLSRCLAKGDKYTEQADYTNAQSAYENALKIDTASVEAYRGMADNFVAQGNIQEAKQILYTGWEQTQDEGLLHYYCVELYNEAVHEINEGNCTLATVDKCIQVLEQEPDNADAPRLLSTCYERLFRTEEEEAVCSMFFDTDTAQDTCSYAEYESLVHRMLALYQAKPTEAMKAVLTQYVLIDMPYVQISIPHLETYRILLTEVNSSVNDAGITETMACLARVKEVSDYFAEAFQEFEAGNYAYARELVVQESYQQIRDSFIEGNSGYWEGSVYIPVNREQLMLHREDDKVRFYFLSEEDYDNHQGIIKVWGTKQEDDGVQRSGISYEPAVDSGEDSKTEYTVQYLYSNVKIGGEYVPQMNYRFETKVTTQEGITTNAIGDWGGEHEWEIDY